MVVLLAALEPDIADRQVLCSSLNSLCEPGSSRELLAITWQVEGAALALTFAAALFAFESAARQRSSLALHEYAKRAGLLQFVMLGASGLIVVGVALAWSPGRPPVAASAFALGVAGLGIAMFPIFVRQAIDVVGPAWFRQQRLKDIQRAVEIHVRSEALAMAAIIELDSWLKDHPTVTRAPWTSLQHVPVEVASREGTVFDIDLHRMETLASNVPKLQVLAQIGMPASGSSTLLAALESPKSKARKPVITLLKGEPDDVLTPQVNALHEEALEAIRSGSPLAGREVRQGYVELLLAWPRAWGQLGERLQGGILTALYPFRIGPIDEIQHHLWIQLERAIESGLREHVETITSIPWLVAREAIELRADDLVKKVNELA